MSGFPGIALRKVFKGHVDLVDMAKWTRPQIKKLLHGVVDKPADFGVKIENQASVVKIAKSLYDFDYENTDRLRIFTKSGVNGKRVLDEQIVVWNGFETPLCSVYDGYGYLLSNLGIESGDATQENYFGLLLGAYSQNLVALGGSVKMAPSRASLTWKENLFGEKPILLTFDPPQTISTPPTDYEIALGASIGAAGDLKNVIQQARWTWMVNNGGLNLGPSPDLSLIRTVARGRGQLFGHCAETIPLIVLLGTTNPLDAKDVAGICMDVGLLTNEVNAGGFVMDRLRKCLVDACPNCTEILRQFRADPEKFKAQYADIVKIFKHEL